jgi:hypothetical protein
VHGRDAGVLQLPDGLGEGAAVEPHDDVGTGPARGAPANARVTCGKTRWYASP